MKDLRLGVLQGYVLDDLDADVARRFEAAVSIFSRAGANLKEVHFSALMKFQIAMPMEEFKLLKRTSGIVN